MKDGEDNASMQSITSENNFVVCKFHEHISSHDCLTLDHSKDLGLAILFAVVLFLWLFFVVHYMMQQVIIGLDTMEMINEMELPEIDFGIDEIEGEYSDGEDDNDEDDDDEDDDDDSVSFLFLFLPIWTLHVVVIHANDLIDSCLGLGCRS